MEPEGPTLPYTPFLLGKIRPMPPARRRIGGAQRAWVHTRQDLEKGKKERKRARKGPDSGIHPSFLQG